MKRLSLVILLTSIWSLSFSQEKEFTDITDILEKYAEHSAAEEFEKALEVLERVPNYDSLYEAVAVEVARLNMDLEHWDKALALCNWGLGQKGENMHLFYQNRGVIYNETEKYEQALESNAEALRIFPELIALKYNTAVTYKLMGEYDKARELYQNVILKSPYHSSAHYELGQLALRDNETARAMMCFNTYFICEDNLDKQNYVLRYLNEIVSTKRDSVPIGIFKDSEENFDRINLILGNYVSLDKSYKTGTKLDIAAVKQNHMLFAQLAELPDGKKGFWNEFYIPLYKAIIKSGNFENFSFYMLRASANEKHKKMVKKKEGDLAKFHSWIVAFLTENWSMVPTDKPDEKILRVYHDNNVPKRIGPYNVKKDQVVGKWDYYNKNGMLKVEGSFVENEQDGLWKWYHEDGSLKEETTFKKGKVDGTMKFQYSNGNVQSEGNYKDGEEEGSYKEFYLNGVLKRTAFLKDGKTDGAISNYYVNGVLADSTQMKESEKHGEFRYYYNDGTLKAQGSAKEDKSSGTLKEFHPNKQLETEYSYNEDGDAHGPYKEYFINGNISLTGEFKDGKRIGKHISYNIDGSIYSESNYDENGKENGGRTYYDTDGKPHEVYVFTKGLIAQYQFLDNDGNVIKEAKKKGSNFDYESIYFDGTIKSHGTFNVKGGKEGLWKFYDSDGVLESEQNFSTNEQEGKQTYYFANGQISSEYEMIEGLDEGEFKKYYWDGTLKRHGRYLNGKMVGEWFNYHSNGVIESIEYYVNDDKTYEIEYNLDGKNSIELFYVEDLIDQIVYYDNKGEKPDTFNFKAGDGAVAYKYENGQLQVTGQHLLGYRHGLFKYHEFDGRVNSQGNYVLGEMDGKWEYFHENSQKSETVVYLYGEKHGPYKKWDWFGNLESEGTYFHGQLHGKKTNYYADGTVESTSEYKYGDLEGKREFFAPTGDLQMIRYYTADILHSYSYLGKDNKPVPPIKVNRMKDRLTAYYPNGQISREYDMDRGMIMGELKEYLSSGKPSYTGTFEGGQEQGKLIYYDKNGQIESEREYKVGEENGFHIVYWPNGKKRIEIPYYLGKMHGNGAEYDKNGKKTIEYEFYSNQLIGEKKL